MKGARRRMTVKPVRGQLSKPWRRNWNELGWNSEWAGRGEKANAVSEGVIKIYFWVAVRGVCRGDGMPV